MIVNGAAIQASRDQAWAAYADRLPEAVRSTMRSLLKEAFITGWLEGAITQCDIDRAILREELPR